MAMANQSSPVKILITILVSTIFSLTLSECILRLMGYKPWIYRTLDLREPTMHEPNLVLGWRNKKGTYTIPPYYSGGTPIQMSFKKNGLRTTGEYRKNPRGEIVFVGGSFTQGWAVSDDETFAWKVQQKHPLFKVLNYGTGGYGSYQSLLVLENELSRTKSPKCVLYGFVQHHEERNVAPAYWLKILSSYSKRAHVNVPFAALGPGGILLRNPPEKYLSLPFRESLASVALIEDAYMQLKTKNRIEHKRVVTESILLEMKRVSNNYGAVFIVLLLFADDKTKHHYIDFLKENKINYLDCIFPLTWDFKVRGEGHPNGKAHSIWANQISESLDHWLTNGN